MKKQTNIQSGLRAVNAGEDLTSKELRLVAAADAGSVLEVLLPTTVKDLCLYVVEEGAAHDSDATVRPLEAGEQIRITAKSTGSAGDVLVLADPGTAADKGKVRTVPTTEGAYFSPGIAEEDFVDGQDVLVRVFPRLVNVGTAFTSAAPASTAPTNSSPYGFSQAQAQAILTNLIELRAFAVAQGWKATS